MNVTGAPSVHAYGEHRDQFAELRLPPEPAGNLPVAVLIHGGFWRARYDLRLADALVTDLAARGFAVWNLEYRRLGLLRRGGGWPETMLDVAAGIDGLADASAVAGPALDLDRVVAIGHSAGGQLALWAAARAGMPAEAPGAGPRVALAAAVAQAGVVDLAEAQRLRVGGGVVRRLLGATAAAEPDRYALASPVERLPFGVPHLLVHGERDEIVPPSLSRRHHARAVEAGDDCELELIAGAGHFEHLDPASEAWATTVRWLERRLP